MGQILVVGSLNMNTTIVVPHIPVADETILAKSVYVNPSGKGVNPACAVGKLGRKVGMLVAIGNDESGQILIDNMWNAGVDVSSIVVSREGV